MTSSFESRWGRARLVLATAMSVLAGADRAWALPPATSVFCETYPEVPACASGVADCSTCHTVPPARNVYGTQIEAQLASGVARPLDAETFAAALPAALEAVEAADADGDGFANLDEISAGSSPADADLVPTQSDPCSSELPFRSLDVCGFDPTYTFKKLHLDFCGRSPSFEEGRSFLESADPRASLLTALEGCLKSEYWRGKDGAVWNLANAKINPLRTLKVGEDAPDGSVVVFTDYYDDYNFFVHAHTGDRDVRDLLVGDYYVTREVGPDGTRYVPYERSALDEIRDRGFNAAQLVERGRRAGMLTHRWFLMSHTMFASLPRTTAAQAYRAYLGLDISRLEGLQPIPDEPFDYDAKGVASEECAVCHSTLDPLTYPFTRYEGLGGGSGPGRGPAQYRSNRLDFFEAVDGPFVSRTPEAGAVLGVPVSNLVEWARVAAQSEAFAEAVVRDYWQLLMGESPRPSERGEFIALSRSLMAGGYSVEGMLRELIFTEAYSVP
ncbi:MAG: hypothetical protein AAFZ18_14090 [Myxococcota bacterium]